VLLLRFRAAAVAEPAMPGTTSTLLWMPVIREAIRVETRVPKQDMGPVRWEFRIDPAFGADFQPMGILGDGSDYLTEVQLFGSCSYPDLPLWVIQAEMEGGDTVTLHKRYQEPGGGSGPAVIVWAEVALDGVVHTTEDPFQLVYAAFHHNFDQDYLVILDPPHDDVHAVLFEHVWEWQAPTDMIYLDQGMSELRRAAVIQYSEVEQ
jgi:hypothetical protein